MVNKMVNKKDAENMREDQHRFLMVSGTLPARLTIEQTAWVLGFNQHDIPVLVGAGLLKTLGRPAASGSKYFAALELEELRKNTRWLAKASDAVVSYWIRKNATRRSRKSGVSPIPGQATEGVGY